MTKRRPKHLNLFKIHQPIIAVVSIAHRLSGLLLAVLTPVLIYALQRSLHDARGYAEVLHWFDLWWIRLGLLVAVWALAHHLLAGLRHLYQDLGWGGALRPARFSAWLVASLALGITLLVAIGVVL